MECFKLNTENTKLSKDISVLKTDKLKIQSEYNKLKNSLDNVDVDNLKKQNEELENENKKIHQELLNISLKTIKSSDIIYQQNKQIDILNNIKSKLLMGIPIISSMLCYITYNYTRQLYN